MSKFKVGDMVRRLNSSFGEMKVGDVGKVISINPSGDLGFNRGCGYHDAKNFELVSSDRRSSTTAEQWQFQSKHISDINWEAMASDLSYKNPLLLVERGDRFFVVVSRLLYNKADTIHYPPPYGLGRFDDILHFLTNGYVFEATQSNFSDWIAWAKTVKAAPWPDKDDQVVKVKVAHI